jgi:hypothetical protein
MNPRRTAADARGDASGYLDATRAIRARHTFAYAVRRTALRREPRGDVGVVLAMDVLRIALPLWLAM